MAVWQKLSIFDGKSETSSYNPARSGPSPIAAIEKNLCLNFQKIARNGYSGLLKRENDIDYQIENCLLRIGPQ